MYVFIRKYVIMIIRSIVWYIGYVGYKSVINNWVNFLERVIIDYGYKKNI